MKTITDINKQASLAALNNLNLKKVVTKRVDALKEIRRESLIQELSTFSTDELLEISLAASNIRWEKLLQKAKKEINE